MRERDIIERLRSAFNGWGIGDDAAVLAPPEGDLLFASDAVVEGIHFRLEYVTLGQIVQKVITSNVSDIYAMGGVPHSILITAGLPAGCGEAEAEGIIEGASLACETYGVRLVGGDTVRSPGGYFFDVAITGSVAWGRAVRRSGASPGDAVVLFGECGGSLAGLLLLEALFDAGRRDASRGDAGGDGRRNYGGALRSESMASDQTITAGALAFIEMLVPQEPAVREAVKRIIPLLSLSVATGDIEHLCDGHGLRHETVPLMEIAARHLVPRAHPLNRSVLETDSRMSDAPSVSAMIDISDGTARDLTTLCVESGVGAVVEEALFPIHTALERMRMTEGDEKSRDDESTGPTGSISQKDLTELALSSGEEYVMLAAVRGLADGAVPPGGTVIGRIVERDEGITLVARNGERRPLPPLGYEHLF